MTGKLGSESPYNRPKMGSFFLDIALGRNADRNVVGLYRTRTGGILALGFGGECDLDAMAGQFCLAPFHDYAEKTRKVQILDRTACNLDLRPGTLQHLPESQRHHCRINTAASFPNKYFFSLPFGRLFLEFIGVSVFISLVLVVLRRRSLASKRQIESFISKEGTFLLANVLMVGSILVIFLGTLILLLNPNPRAEKASQLVPFFNQVNMPIFLAILLVAGICGVISWRHASAQNLKRNLLRPLVAALAVGVVLFVFGLRHWYPLIALVVCLLVPFTHVVEWYRGTKSRHNNLKESYPKAFLKLILADRPRYGGFIIHLSLICIAIGIIGSATLGTTKEVALMPGESMTVDSYTLVYKGLNYDATLGRETFVANLLVYDGSKLVGEYTPSIYFDINFNQQVSQAAIRSNPVQDLYIAVDGWNIGGATAISVGIYPMLMWLWIGSWLMMVGGLIAFWPEKEKVRETAGAEEQ